MVISHPKSKFMLLEKKFRSIGHWRGSRRLGQKGRSKEDMSLVGVEASGKRRAGDEMAFLAQQYYRPLEVKKKEPP